MNTPENPFEAPRADTVDPVTTAMAATAAMRREYLNHEASVKSVGLFFYVGAAGNGVIGVLNLPVAVETYLTLVNGIAPISDCILRIALAPCLLVLGRWIRRLDNRARKPTVGLCLGICVYIVFKMEGVAMYGTLAIEAYIIYLMLSPKSNVVFSDQYADAMRQTPYIYYKVSWIVWVFLALLVGVIALGKLVASFN